MKTQIKILISIFAGILLFIIIMTQPALAVGLQNVNEAIDITASGAGVKSDISLIQYVGAIISIFLGILGLIFLLLTIFAGFQWMTAMGNEEKVTKAKKMLTNSVIGLIIIVISYSLSTFIINALTNQPQ